MNCRHYLSVLVTVAIFSALISPVCAMIESKWDMRKLYVESKVVMVGKTTEIVVEKKVISLEFAKALKGISPGPKVRIVVPDSQANLLKDVKLDQPVVFFLSNMEVTPTYEGEAILHIADRWYRAVGVPTSKFLIWRISSNWEEVIQSFPGRTSTLAKLVTDVNAGNDDTLMNKFAKIPFNAGMRKLGKLELQKPQWLLAEDLNGDKKPDLVVGTPAGTKVYLASGESYQDATAQWGALGSGAYHAAGDVNGDGKVDLLLDGVLWINDGQKFTQAKMTFGIPPKPLAAALIDANGDQKLDAVFLTAGGEVRVYENSGTTDKPWAAKTRDPLWSGGDTPVFAAIGDFGDSGKPHALVVSANGVTRYALDADGGPPADFARLTGIDLKKVGKFADGLKNPTAVVLSMNGGGRPDLCVFSDGNPLLLINRGLGAFFHDDFSAHKDKKALPYTPSPASVWARANMHGKAVDDVLVLAEDGTLYVMENPQ